MAGQGRTFELKHEQVGGWFRTGKDPDAIYHDDHDDHDDYDLT